MFVRSPRRLIAAAPALFSAVFSFGAISAEAAGVLVPQRKAGQWEMQLQANGKSGPSIDVCIDRASDQAMMDSSLSIITALCPVPHWSREGDAIVIVADCQVSPGRSVNSRAELRGDFQSDYTFSLKTKRAGASGTQVSLLHRYVWASRTCSDGLRPGFVRLPNGGKMKLKSMMRLLESMNEQ